MTEVLAQDDTVTFQRLPMPKVDYSLTAIIRNAKIWHIILLLAFFRTLSSNLDLENPAVSEENCLKNLLPLP